MSVRTGCFVVVEWNGNNRTDPREIKVLLYKQHKSTDPHEVVVRIGRGCHPIPGGDTCHVAPQKQ